ncbi:MAG: amidohydrolase [Candidatus Mcinerneyibacterium aminivorans]|uniref:Amidohydrolase n=1 Tax=Candidatus Mcinerneyibacterium aminivorans TaxID=2703815 RepID=A0A5D0MI93_9BACT|nr:MAG: amidohydrolase [Candidatus Mcinerneyibacterium aminivorans]
MTMGVVDRKNVSKLVNFRHDLHRNPELSGREKNTADRIVKFMKDYKPDHIITGIGGNGCAFVYKGKQKGPVVVFRADMDALPIREKSELNYSSKKENVAHMCGHDGHMVTLAGVGVYLCKQRPQKGTIILLYQPSEETGQGAKRIIKDELFKNYAPDYIFSFHNIPGYEKNEIVLKKGNFSAASVGMSIKLQGISSHAAHPEKGISPVVLISEIIDKFETLNNYDEKNFRFGTIVGVNVGEKSFGTMPEKGVLHATLRARTDKNLDKMKNIIKEFVDKKARKRELEYKIEWKEEFKSIKNSVKAYKILKKAIQNKKLKYTKRQYSFRWSEDFGEYSKYFDSCFFGLGIGENAKNLHNPYYFFPDEIIETGIAIYISILKQLKLI